MADAQPIRRRRPKVPIEHTCDGTDKQHCPCMRARRQELRREARRARGLLKLPIEHTCDGTNLRGCACARERRRAMQPPDYLRRRELRTKYGLTLEDWQRLYEAQDGRCGICGRPEDDVRWGDHGRRGLVVDHSHQDGAVRGLLCNGCNRGLGYLWDNPDLLEAGARWLRAPR